LYQAAAAAARMNSTQMSDYSAEVFSQLRLLTQTRSSANLGLGNNTDNKIAF